MKSKNKFVIAEGVMEIDFDVHMWHLLENGFLPNIEIVGLVQLSTGEKAAITIKASTANEFGMEHGKKMSSSNRLNVLPSGDYQEEVFDRIASTLLNYILLETPHWLIFGSVKSRSGGEDTPIFMLYSKVAKRAFYSIKRRTDTGEGGPSSAKFSPTMN